MLSDAIGRAGKFLLDRIVRVFSFFHINPNLLTFTGVLFSFWAAFEFGYGNLFRGGLVIILAGLFDMLDGQVARINQSATEFGAFYDSVIDRYSDVIILQGLMVHYAREQRLGYVVLVGVVVMGAVLTSYTRARAESLIPKCKVGFMERPERIVLLIIGGLSGRMEAVLWVLAVLGNWTVFDRIYFTWKELPKPSRVP
ncbi:MAG: CDP-alcohol phosphatidyltransferase family protein [Acidobacteriota bacterium]|jgi:CDP-diacylglycerol--glycerol-3-phosphate 3-phosphatidyltransferase|nr:CDP-alcohol phosphatidyltransferase family protein [Acidobacteriota bacterium]NLT33937.1 CDP-alcohol phosphatidyltransferase family protein [Acidobacteriota bacterium]